jgi:DNA-binding transcriptional regulator YiaG
MIEKSKLLLTSPTAAQVKAARESTDLSTDEIASWFGFSDGSAWRKKEIQKQESNNKRLLKPMEYEMLLLLSDTHPNLKIIDK